MSNIPLHFQSRRTLWLCALIPFLIAPAAASLVYALRNMHAPEKADGPDLKWIAIVSAVNIIVSALLISKIYFLLNDLSVQGPLVLREALREFIYGILRLFYAPLPPAMKPTPV